MIKNIRDNYRIYGLLIVKIAKIIDSVRLNGLLNATFEPPKHACTHHVNGGGNFVVIIIVPYML
jgi:hypothetical protein